MRLTLNTMLTVRIALQKHDHCIEVVDSIAINDESYNNRHADQENNHIVILSLIRRQKTQLLKASSDSNNGDIH